MDERAGWDEGLPVVIFGLGGGRYAMEASKVVSMAAGAEGRSLAGMLGVAGAVGARSRGLRLAAQAVVVEEPVVLKRLPEAAFHPLPELLLARCESPALCALAWDQGQLVVMLDPDRFPPASGGG